MTFFERLKKTFKEIPIKTRFLKDLGFNNSYSGFRYFMQDRKETPSPKFMKKLCENLEYEYIMIPVKKTEESEKHLQVLENLFFDDLDTYLKTYEGDVARVYVKDFGNESIIADAAEAFSTTSVFDEEFDIDASTLF